MDSSFALLTRYNQPFSLAIFDIDHFKQHNDSRGHGFGDQLLQSVAHTLTTADADDGRRRPLRGGCKFVVIMPHTDLEGATVYADKIRGALRMPGW